MVRQNTVNTRNLQASLRDLVQSAEARNHLLEYIGYKEGELRLDNNPSTFAWQILKLCMDSEKVGGLVNEWITDGGYSSEEPTLNINKVLEQDLPLLVVTRNVGITKSDGALSLTKPFDEDENPLADITSDSRASEQIFAIHIRLSAQEIRTVIHQYEMLKAAGNFDKYIK